MSKLKPCPIDLMKIRALCYDGALRAYVEDEYIYLKDTVSGEIVWIGDAAQPANEPLTLERLREIGQDPVWIVDTKHPECSGWMQYGYCEEKHNWMAFWMFGNEMENEYFVDDYGKTWCAYRRPPDVLIGVDLASGHDSTAYCRKPEADNGE